MGMLTFVCSLSHKRATRAHTERQASQGSDWPRAGLNVISMQNMVNEGELTKIKRAERARGNQRLKTMSPSEGRQLVMGRRRKDEAKKILLSTLFSSFHRNSHAQKRTALLILQESLNQIFLDTIWCSQR